MSSEEAAQGLTSPDANTHPGPRVLLIGMGALGCAIAPLLAAESGVLLTLCDGDTVALSNWPRQWLYGADDQGKLKVEVARHALLRSHPKAQIETWPLMLDESHHAQLAQFDLLIDGSDRADLKFTLSDLARRQGLNLVTGGASGWGGFALSMPAARATACLRCLFGAGAAALGDSCARAGVFTPLPRLIGLMMARMAIALVRPQSQIDPRTLYSLDLSLMRARMMNAPQDSACEVCATMREKEC